MAAWGVLNFTVTAKVAATAFPELGLRVKQVLSKKMQDQTQQNHINFFFLISNWFLMLLLMVCVFGRFGPLALDSFLV